MNNIEFGRGKDKQKRKSRMQGLKNNLRQRAMALRSRAGDGFASGFKSAQQTSKKVRQAAEKSPRLQSLGKPTVKGVAQAIGGDLQRRVAMESAKKSGLTRQERAGLAVRGAKNSVIGRVKAAPGTALLKADQKARQFEKMKLKKSKKR